MIEPKLGCDRLLSVNSNVCDLSACDAIPVNCDVRRDESLKDGSLEDLSGLTTNIDQAALVKRGYRDMTSCLTCGVLFESDAVLLWSLRPISWFMIYITEADERRIRQDHPGLFRRIGTKLIIIPSTFRNDYPNIHPDFMWADKWKSGVH